MAHGSATSHASLVRASRHTRPKRAARDILTWCGSQKAVRERYANLHHASHWVGMRAAWYVGGNRSPKTTLTT